MQDRIISHKCNTFKSSVKTAQSYSYSLNMQNPKLNIFNFFQYLYEDRCSSMEANGRFTVAKITSQTLTSNAGGNNNNTFRDQQLQKQQQQQQSSMDSYSKLSSMAPSYLANADDNGMIRNPLFCLMCNQTYQNPCLLSCYHTFCAVCLKGRTKDGKLACPLCG